MSDSPDQGMDRRRFLVSSATGVAATIGAAEASPPASGILDLAARASVVLHDRRIALPKEVQQRLGANGARTMALEGDPVRLWRSEAGALLRDPSTTLLGVTGWADLLIFRGMAAETRRHLRHERLDASTGSFIWLIA